MSEARDLAKQYLEDAVRIAQSRPRNLLSPRDSENCRSFLERARLAWIAHQDFIRPKDILDTYVNEAMALIIEPVEERAAAIEQKASEAHDRTERAEATIREQVKEAERFLFHLEAVGVQLVDLCREQRGRREVRTTVQGDAPRNRADSI